jgi:hypothetical protein
MHWTSRRGIAVRVTLLALAGGSCNWVSLAKNSLTYHVVRRGEAANLVAVDSLVYTTLAEDGFAVLDARSGKTLATVAPAEGSESIHDLAVAEGLLFVLDARKPGHLSVYSLEDPTRPRLVSPPEEVPVGPFSGVSASRGLCIVSGGTSQLTAWEYDTRGALTGPVATADLGRGQPDVLVAADGRLVYVSTHYRGPYFGLDVLRYDPVGRRLETLAELELDGAGFTEGGAKPANFPIEAALLGGGRDTLLVATARGVAVIDISIPERPQLLGTVDVGGPAVNVDALGGVAAVTVGGGTPAVAILDFARGAARAVGRLPLPVGTFPAGVALTGPRAAVAVAGGDHGVMLLNR